MARATLHFSRTSTGALTLDDLTRVSAETAICNVLGCMKVIQHMALVEQYE
jgi:hypothetical protein